MVSANISACVPRIIVEPVVGKKVLLPVIVCAVPAIVTNEPPAVEIWSSTYFLFVYSLFKVGAADVND